MALRKTAFLCSEESAHFHLLLSQNAAIASFSPEHLFQSVWWKAQLFQLGMYNIFSGLHFTFYIYYTYVCVCVSTHTQTYVFFSLCFHFFISRIIKYSSGLSAWSPSKSVLCLDSSALHALRSWTQWCFLLHPEIVLPFKPCGFASLLLLQQMLCSSLWCLCILEDEKFSDMRNLGYQVRHGLLRKTLLYSNSSSGNLLVSCFWESL